MTKIVILLSFLLTTLLSFEVQKPKIYQKQNITGWYMSEKLDWIRGYWDRLHPNTKKQILFLGMNGVFNFKEAKQSVAILSQIKLVDSKRLDRKIGKMKQIDFNKLKKELIRV